MESNSRHILLMGFKHVGKSCVGRELARHLGLPFYELDGLTENQYFQETGQHKNCRQIVASVGEDRFRHLESEALREALLMPTGVIALGGGTPMPNQNRPLIRSQVSVHITAPQDTVRARVMTSGWPQAQRFDELWKERDLIYRELALFTIENTGTIENVVQRLVPLIKSNIR